MNPAQDYIKKIKGIDSICNYNNSISNINKYKKIKNNIFYSSKNELIAIIQKNLQKMSISDLININDSISYRNNRSENLSISDSENHLNVISDKTNSFKTKFKNHRNKNYLSKLEQININNLVSNLQPNSIDIKRKNISKKDLL